MRNACSLLLTMMLAGQVQAQEVFWSEDFGTGTCAFRNQLATAYVGLNGSWTQSILASEGGIPNQFFISATETFTGAGNCSSGCIVNATLTDQSLHVGSLGVGGCPAGDCGATYNGAEICDFFGSCSPGSPNGETHKRIESPFIDATGRSEITVSFDYIMYGEIGSDVGSFAYFDGISWTNLVVPLTPQTNCCGGPCGEIGTVGQWSGKRYSIDLPPGANNNPNLKIGFLWDNNDNGVGRNPSFAVDNIQLSVEPGSYFVGGQVIGLLGGNALVLQNNTGDDLPLNENGAFVFATPVTVGEMYSVTVQVQPDDPIQPCSVSDGSGTITNQDITDVVITCEVGDDLIFRDGFN